MAEHEEIKLDDGSSRLRFHNPRTKGLTLILEPWGEVRQIRPGTTLDVICEGPEGDGPEVTYDENTITVWGWAGSILHIVQEGAAATTERTGRPAVPVHENAVSSTSQESSAAGSVQSRQPSNNPRLAHIGRGSTLGRSKIIPLAERIVVKNIEAVESTASGLVIPDTAKEKPQQGEVVAVGPGRLDDKGQRIPMDIDVGDRILYAKYSGNDVKIDETEYLVLSEKDILAKIEVDKPGRRQN